MDKDLDKKRRDEMATKIFWFSFQTIFIFGIPAFLASYIGLKLDNFYNTGRKITLIMLLFSFIFSWTVIILKYRKISREIK